MLEWDDLRYFLAFARAGSMQAAAKALGVNQSTVQRRVAELESRVGQRLVECAVQLNRASDDSFWPTAAQPWLAACPQTDS
jgi:DNA-binding transcriptional LysR family regulator